MLKNKPLIILGCCLILQACNPVNDYMLGKDNTPVPTALQPLKATSHWVQHWSVPAGKGYKSRSYLKLQPVVVGSIVYTADPSGMVQAANKITGKQEWARQLKHPLLSGPTVKAGYIAIGTNAASVVLLNQVDGKTRWTVRVSGDVLAKPIITKDKVIVKTVDGNVYALSLSTGEKLWASLHGAPSLILNASSSPVIAGELVVVGFSDGKLDALDLATGRVMWQRSIAYASGSSDVERLVDIDADPIVRGDLVYLASYQGYIGALSLTTGEFVWRKPASVYKNITVSANTLYVTDSDDVVWAIDAHQGHVRWKQEALKARGLTEPVLMGNQLIVGDKLGFLHGLSTENGAFVSRTQLSAAIDISPVVSDHSVYVLLANGTLNRISTS